MALPLNVVLNTDNMPKIKNEEELLTCEQDSVFVSGTYTGFANENIFSQFREEFLSLSNCYLVVSADHDQLLILDQKFQIHEICYPKSWWYHRYLTGNTELNLNKNDFSSAQKISGVSFLTSNTIISDNLFHLSIDNYSRLYYLSNEMKEKNISVLFPKNRALSADFQEFHDTFTQDLNDIFLEPGIYKIEKLIIPPRSFILEHLIEKPFQFVREKIKERFVRRQQKHHHSRIFVSRSDTIVRNLSNEAELIKALKPLGFTAICPGDFSLGTQLELFSSAEIVVGIHGMGLASIITTSDDCRGVFEFEALNWTITGYRAMCAVMKTTHGFLPHRLITTDGPGQFHWLAEADIPKTIELILEVLSGQMSPENASLLTR